MRTTGGWQGNEGPAWTVNFRDIDEQLVFLRAMVSRARGNPRIRALALKIIREAGAPEKDKRAQANAIGTWVQENIYYVHELPERFQTPELTAFTLKAGDCDDSTTLVCSLLESIGIPSALVCMSLDGVWAHIFPAALLTGVGGSMQVSNKVPAMLPLDTTMSSHVSDNRNPVAWAQSRGKAVELKIV